MGLEDSTNNAEEEYEELFCQQIAYVLTKVVTSPAPTASRPDWPTSHPSVQQIASVLTKVVTSPAPTASPIPGLRGA